MYSTYTKDQVKNFVAQYGDIIVQAITNKNLFFAAVVGQLTVESKWGTSDLSAKHNNYGGIKATGSQFSSGQVTLDTTEVVNGKEIGVKDSFAAYSDFKNFMNDYVRVLALPSYVSAGVYSAQSPYDQVLAIGKGGYSTRDPKAYLALTKDRINACLDQFPIGKIDTTAVVDGDSVLPNSFLTGVSSVLNSINQTLGSSLGGATVKPAQ